MDSNIQCIFVMQFVLYLYYEQVLSLLEWLNECCTVSVD